jgi:hypothetical protein
MAAPLSPALGRRPIVPLRVARRCAVSHTASSYSVMFCRFHMPFGRRPMAGQSRAARWSVASAWIRSIRASWLLTVRCLRFTCASPSTSTVLSRSRPATYALYTGWGARAP